MEEKISLSEIKVLIGQVLNLLSEQSLLNSKSFEANFKRSVVSLQYMYNELAAHQKEKSDYKRDVVIRINYTKCTGCGRCIMACGQNVLKYNYLRSVKIRVADSNNCTGCLRCMGSCKYNAIDIKRYI